LQRGEMPRVEVGVGNGEQPEPLAAEPGGEFHDYVGDGPGAEGHRAGEAAGEVGRGVGEGRKQHGAEPDSLEVERPGPRHRPGDDHVGLERQVGTVGLDGADRQDRDGARAGGVARLLPGHCGEREHGYSVLMQQLNIADFFLDARVREGRGDRTALITDAGRWSYREVQAQANRYANLLRAAGVAAEQRVIIALPDGPDYVAALFGTLKIGAVVVMVNPELKPEAIEYFFGYSRAVVALVAAERADAFRAAAGRSAHAPALLVVGDPAWEPRLAAA